MTYDDFIEFYQIESAHAKEQVQSWQERLDAVEDALEKMVEARRKQRLTQRAVVGAKRGFKSKAGARKSPRN